MKAGTCRIGIGLSSDGNSVGGGVPGIDVRLAVRTDDGPVGAAIGSKSASFASSSKESSSTFGTTCASPRGVSTDIVFMLSAMIIAKSPLGDTGGVDVPAGDVSKAGDGMGVNIPLRGNEVVSMTNDAPTAEISPFTAEAS